MIDRFKVLIPHRLRQAILLWLKRRSHSLSQFGQDLWVFGEVFNEMRGGYFVDLGAHDGFGVSNTYLLEKRYGWTGICIEANPQSFRELERARNCRCVNLCVSNHEETVEFVLDATSGGILGEDCDNQTKRACETVQLTAVPLIQILEQAKAPAVIDYLSVDIEGAEDRALLEFDFDRYRFKCMTIERPSAKLRAVLEANGYWLAKEIPNLDCFYLHESMKDTYRTHCLRFGFKRFLFKRWR